MKRKVSFYKENGSWYADVPLVPKSSNLMVAGADKFLDNICEGSNCVTLTVTTNLSKVCAFCLERVKHDFWGGIYSPINALTGEKHDNLWLCNVTHFVLGRHPKFIGIIRIEL